MKRAILLVIFLAAGFAGGALWMRQRTGAASTSAEEHAEHAEHADKATAGPQVSRDTNGTTVITLSSKTQKDLGIQLKSPTAFQMSPEAKGYGRVQDPAPLAALLTELASAQGTYGASSNELSRLKTLAGQGNASARALQTAEAAAAHDLIALQSVRERLLLSWGKAVADQKDLPGFVKSLTSLEAALVRVDLPVGETLKEPPVGARFATLSGQSSEAELLGRTLSVDPQMQGQGFIFLVKPNSLRLVPGEAVVGFLKISGEPLTGVNIPREAVVRTEGAGWMYVLQEGGGAFARIEVALDHPTEAGWFVTQGASTNDHVIVTGAQQLLSLELKGQGGGE